MISIHVLYHIHIAVGYINNYNMLSIGSHKSNAVLQWSCDACTCLTLHIFTYSYATKYICTIQYINIYMWHPPSGPGGPCLRFHGLFRPFHVNVLWTWCVQSASLVLGCYVIYGAVTSCVTSRRCMCSGHVTFSYKRSAGTSFWALFTLLALASS